MWSLRSSVCLIRAALYEKAYGHLEISGRRRPGRSERAWHRRVCLHSSTMIPVPELAIVVALGEGSAEVDLLPESVV